MEKPEKILVFGSLNMDLTFDVDHFVQPGETMAANSVETFCGGKGLNQAIALSKGETPVYMAGQIGSDGLFLKERLNAESINTDFVLVSDLDTSGKAIIQKDQHGENSILLYPGANTRILPEQMEETLDQFEKNDLIVLQNEINDVDKLIRVAKEKGLQIAFTPAPASSALQKWPLELCDFLLLNLNEARTILNTEESDPKALLEMLHFVCPDTGILLTMSKDGALYADSNGITFQPAFSVETEDTTGAGDTFAGTFLAALASDKDVKSALEQAAAASALSVTKPGAADSIPSAVEVEAFLQEHSC